jgi:MOSC domain-containing protein YiiM
MRWFWARQASGDRGVWPEALGREPLRAEYTRVQDMRVISINISEPRQVKDAAGNTVVTSIYKSTVGGSVQVRELNIDGDRQADLVKHGGPRRAVYMYPSEHYEYWRTQLPGTQLPWGAFGENLTIEGLLEHDVRVGDRLRVGSVELVVTRPRKPCFKLAIRLNQRDMVARFRASGRSGFYLSVSREGELCAGDAIARVERGTGPTIPEMLADYNAMQTRIALPRPIADEFDSGAAKYVARVEPITDAGGALESQRDRVVAQLSALSAEQAAFRYAPGKWSVTEVVGHLSDLERTFAYRLMRIGRGDETPLAGVDENVVMRGAAFDRRAHADVLEEWTTVRNATVSLVRGMPSEAWARYGRANDHLVTTRALVYIILGHVEHHLAVLSERYHV